MDADWDKELERWLEPFVEALGHRARRRMCALPVLLMRAGLRTEVPDWNWRGVEAGMEDGAKEGAKEGGTEGGKAAATEVVN